MLTKLESERLSLERMGELTYLLSLCLFLGSPLTVVSMKDDCVCELSSLAPYLSLTERCSFRESGCFCCKALERLTVDRY